MNARHVKWYVVFFVCFTLLLMPKRALAQDTGSSSTLDDIVSEGIAPEDTFTLDIYELSETLDVRGDSLDGLSEQAEEVHQFGDSQNTNQAAGQTDTTSTPTQTTSADAQVYTFDAKGNELDLVTTELGNYLFLTNQTDLSALTLYVRDGIVSSDTGTIADDTLSLTADVSKTSSITITTRAGETFTVHIMQSNLPCLYLGLPTTTLEQIHADKNIKHDGNTVTLSDLDDPSHNLDLSAVQAKGRGNTSWQWYEKRGYQLKCAKRTDVLGMGAAKKWVLLASANDPSLIRYKIGLDLAERLGSWYVPEARYVDLWIAGDYRVTYLVTEKVEIDKERVALGADGVIAELDNEFYKSETYELDLWKRHIVLKDPDPEDVGENFSAFMNKYRAFEELLETGASWTEICAVADPTSIARLYIVNEFLSNNEVTVTSQFWYTDGVDDVLHAGPVWDFDSWASPKNNALEYYCYLDRIFTLMENYPEYRNLVTELWNSGAFQQTLADVDSYEALLANSAAMNYSRWNMLGTRDPKGFGFATTYAGCVSDLRSWLFVRLENFRPNAQLIYRAYNPNSGEHFYTHGKSERNHLVSLGWQAEGIGWTAPIVSGQPVFRLYNPNAGDHHYTTNAAERDFLVKLGWNYEGIGWYSDDAQGTALWRVYNPNAVAGAHHFTTAAAERDYLVRLGWRAEGIGWYGL
ncbi:MAG: CotH kinase family protein [Atopobiaceae bacterium]|nr:CotH kinase family protein [Atopobiaceae bacterium]